MSYDKDSKPECYGDYNEYDPDDTDCQDCAFIDACGIRARRAMRMASTRSSTPERRSADSARFRPPSRSSNTTNRRHSGKKRDEIQVFTEPEEKDTYWSVLSHNAGLEAVQAMFDELSNSVRHIPRKSYNQLWKRPKK